MGVMSPTKERRVETSLNLIWSSRKIVVKAVLNRLSNYHP